MRLTYLNIVLMSIRNLSSLSIDTLYNYLLTEHGYSSTQIELKNQLDELCLLGYLTVSGCNQGSYRRMLAWQRSSSSHSFGLYGGLSGERIS